MRFGRRLNFPLKLGNAFRKLLDLFEQQSFSLGQSRGGTVRPGQ
jgi:hypothetical protein